MTAYLAAHLASARLIGRQALTGQALLHGYTTAFWWTAGIFACGAVICGGLMIRHGQRTANPYIKDDQQGAAAGDTTFTPVSMEDRIFGAPVA